MHNNSLNQLTFFGDSLTDLGVMSDLTSRNLVVTVPTPDSGYSRSFTNGAPYSEVMVGLLAASGDLQDAESLAVGGAHAVGSLTFAQYVNTRVGAQLPPGAIYQPDADPAELAMVLDLGGQAARYAADPPAAGGAVAINIGLNDYAEFTPTSPAAAPAEGAALVAAVLAATAGAAMTAADAGADEVILFNLPDFRFFPLSTLRPEAELVLGDQLLAAHNAGLETIAAGLELAGVSAEIVDMNRISAEIRADPGTFGFRAELFAEPALLGTGGNPRLVLQPDGSYLAVFPANPAVAGVDPDQLGFWDYVHPTEALHGVWGAFAAESLRSATRFLGDGDDFAIGTRGRDLILGGAGDDRIAARGGPDVVLAGLGDDFVLGGAGADILAGGSGRDLLLGGAGSDVLAGGAGRDRSFGGMGRDLLIDGAGFDLLAGGAAADAFVLVAGRGGGGVMIGGSGFDTAYLVLDAATRATVAAELDPGATTQRLRSIDLTTRGIEDFVLLDPADGLDRIHTPARLHEADLWGLV